MKIKTSELHGAALDWVVAKCEGDTSTVQFSALASSRHYFAPSKKWAQGGPIIEREKIEVTPWGVSGEWRARDFFEPSPGVPCAEQFGPTPLTAAMRCYCVSKLGDEIEIPDELRS